MGTLMISIIFALVVNEGEKSTPNSPGDVKPLNE